MKTYKMTKKKWIIGIIICVVALITVGFVASYRNSSHRQMIGILENLNKQSFSFSNPFCPEGKLAYFNATSKPGNSYADVGMIKLKAAVELKVGNEEESVKLYENLVKKLDIMSIDKMLPDMAIAYMRLGERNNCMLNHKGSSCIFPIKDGGVHKIKTGSTKAIAIYEAILKSHPDDLESRWLLNICLLYTS